MCLMDEKEKNGNGFLRIVIQRKIYMKPYPSNVSKSKGFSYTRRKGSTFAMS